MTTYAPIRVSNKLTTRAVYTEVADGYLIIVSKQATSGGAINFLRQIAAASRSVESLKTVTLLLPDATEDIRCKIDKDIKLVSKGLGSTLKISVIKKDHLTDCYLKVVTRVFNGV